MRGRKGQVMKLLAQLTVGLVVIVSFAIALNSTQGPSEQEISDHEQRMIEPVDVDPEPVPEPIASTIYYSWEPDCDSCNQFDLLIPSLVKSGWLVSEKDIEGIAPKFEVVVAPQGDVFRKSGFSGKENFESWLREITVKSDTNEDKAVKDQKDLEQNPCPPKRTRYRLFRRR